MAVRLDPRELVALRALSKEFPTAESAAAESAALRALLGCPKGSAHVVSDVHGEYRKLRHIVNNASGLLRPLVARLFEGRLSQREQQELLALLYYPREAMLVLVAAGSDTAARVTWVRATLRRQFEIVRELASRHRRADVESLFPVDLHELFEELWGEPGSGRDPRYIDSIIDHLAAYELDLPAVRAASHLVRNLSVSEIIVAGDLGDRGPRIDRVIDFLMRQPNVSFAWGNHDASWMGACLGNEALIATVLRISLRYRRLSQLEEGYGIIISPLEKLARDVYSDDPAEHFKTKGTGLRDDLLMARMQKAIAVIQFKLEGQLIRRHPEWELEHRDLVSRLDVASGTVEIDGKVHSLRDRHLPTIDPSQPLELSAAEKACVERMRESFVRSAELWKQMSFVARRGAMWLRRDHALLFHGCVPVDAAGMPLALEVDGEPRAGRALFDALDSVVRRAFRKGADGTEESDWLWYLWRGPRSPLFGKDRMTTFEGYFVDDKESHKETKNAYFSMIHDAEFCRRIAREFGMGDDVLIVNGHVPVRVEKGEEPLKRGGNAVTIDGAFSEAYGDRGYTLLLEAERVTVAEHHHFESVEEAIRSGADVVPKVTTIVAYDRARTVGDTEQGEEIRERVALLESLVEAYREGAIG